MLEEEQIFKNITYHLAILSKSIETSSIVNLQDDKVFSENFFKGLFNTIYKLDLKNTNTLKANYPAIDLADEKSGVCWQITSENTKRKIDETKEKYQRHNIAKQYPKLKIFIFAKKPSGREEDALVYYEDDLIKDIFALDLKMKEKVLSYLKENLKSFKEERKTLEIETIQAVIEYLSNQPFDNDSDRPSKPYPEEKFKLRFGEYCEAIRDEYSDCAGYDKALVQAKSSYVDDGNSGKIKAYLRKISRDILYDNKDARDALKKVIETIKENIDVKTLSETALRFYILSELVECDIFPLSDSEEQKLKNNHGSA